MISTTPAVRRKKLYMFDPILLATDLDRTLLPNGTHPESPLARARFRQFVTRPEVKLVYVSGRHRELVIAAIADYDLPQPHFVIADVGTSVYEICGSDWRLCEDWRQKLMATWHACGPAQLAAVLADLPGLRLQEAAKQSALKLSYYTAALDDPAELMAEVQARLAATGADTHLVWSVDETTGTGLLDVLPAGAGKRQALAYLRSQLGIALDKTVFAGDSGNDMEVLVSDMPSVLVANAHDAVRAEAVRRGDGNTLYLARGGLAGMNGCYSAGILEGVMHFLPATRAWLDTGNDSPTRTSTQTE